MTGLGLVGSVGAVGSVGVVGSVGAVGSVGSVGSTLSLAGQTRLATSIAPASELHNVKLVIPALSSVSVLYAASLINSTTFSESPYSETLTE